MTEQAKTFQDLVHASARLESILIETGGEITPELEGLITELLELKSEALPAKVDGVVLMLDRLETIADEWDAKAQRVLKIAKGCYAARDRLKDYVKQSMQAAGITDLPGNDYRLKLSKAKPRLVIDEEKLPSLYTMEVTSYVVDKETVRKALEDGTAVPGAQFVDSFTLRDYPNKK